MDTVIAPRNNGKLSYCYVRDTKTLPANTTAGAHSERQSNEVGERNGLSDTKTQPTEAKQTPKFGK